MLNQIKNWWASRQQLNKPKPAPKRAPVKPRKPAQPAMKGSPMEARVEKKRYPRPTNNRATLRHLRRILLLREYLDENDDISRGKRRSIHNELNRREEKLKEVNVDVPANNDDLRQLIAEYEANG